MSSSSSQYDPPRARGLGHFRKVEYALRRILYASPIKIPDGAGAAICACILPGYAFRFLARPIFAMIALGAYAIAALLFIAYLGLPPASIAFAFMLTLHAVSALVAFHKFVPVAMFGQRLKAALAVLILMTLIYLGLQTAFGKVIMPLRYDGKVYVVNAQASATKIKRGEHVAYHIKATLRGFDIADAHGTFRVEAGFGFGNILGVSGDKIEFTKGSFRVNGVERPRLRGMPEAGEILVPEKRWFIWPDFVIDIQGQGAGIPTSEMLTRMSMVDEKDLAGKIFRQWFWRKQL